MEDRRWIDADAFCIALASICCYVPILKWMDCSVEVLSPAFSDFGTGGKLVLVSGTAVLGADSTHWTQQAARPTIPLF